AELVRLGHKLRVLSSPYSGEVGGGQAVMRDGKGVNYGASDPRKDGAAIPEAPPLFGPRAAAAKGARQSRLPQPWAAEPSTRCLRTMLEQSGGLCVTAPRLARPASREARQRRGRRGGHPPESARPRHSHR